MEAARVLEIHVGIIRSFMKKADRLGGTFIPASAESYKDKPRNLLTWYRRQMDVLDIEVHLNEEVRTRRSSETEAVIIATGAVPRTLKMPGYERMIEACEYLNGAGVGDTVAVDREEA